MRSCPPISSKVASMRGCTPRATGRGRSGLLTWVSLSKAGSCWVGEICELPDRSEADYYADPIPSFKFWPGR